MFELPFDEIAGRPFAGGDEAARQSGAAPGQGGGIARRGPDVRRQRVVVDAFLRAARAGDFDALVAVLDPDVVLREDFSTKRPLRVFHGAAAVASQARAAAVPAEVILALINGAAGAVITVWPAVRDPRLYDPWRQGRRDRRDRRRARRPGRCGGSELTGSVR